ncbi:hypothetical protein [Kitasatospora sp. MAA19]|uniref:hypothetical protein n=1 Tax=Kitasatospora sp. MAA19 TaxID=3035090 RepID=UPI0024758D67|nr:hypothetical protein [Kitasatospora sp. MAA19]
MNRAPVVWLPAADAADLHNLYLAEEGGDDALVAGGQVVVVEAAQPRIEPQLRTLTSRH